MEPSRVELGHRADGSTYTRVVEVPIKNSDGLSWTKVIDGISSGSWAVLLTLGVIFYLAKGSASKYLESHLALMAAMRDTLKGNKEDLDSLAEVIPKQTEILLAIKTHSEETTKKVRKLNDNLPVFQSRYDNLTDAVEELRNVILHSNNQLEGGRKVKRMSAWIGEEHEEEI